MKGSPVIVTCSCGRSYTRSQWYRLPFVGIQRDHHGHPALSCRNCPCGSTRTVDVALDPHTAPENVFRRQLDVLARETFVRVHARATAEDWHELSCLLADLALDAASNARRLELRQTTAQQRDNDPIDAPAAPSKSGAADRLPAGGQQVAP